MSEILQKQGKELIECIKEMEKREENRINRLQKLTAAPNEKNILLVRYEKERMQDQLKIKNLTEDFKLLKIKHLNGELQQLAEKRSDAEKANNSSGKDDERLKLNRFAGLENRDQMLFHADIFNKFDQHDQKFKKKISNVHFNPREEYHKLKLLGEKRDVLRKLVDISEQTVTKRRPYSSSALSVASGLTATDPTWAAFGGALDIKATRPKQFIPGLKLSSF